RRRADRAADAADHRAGRQPRPARRLPRHPARGLLQSRGHDARRAALDGADRATARSILEGEGRGGRRRVMRSRGARAALLVVLAIVLVGCASRGAPVPGPDGDLVRLTLLQVNDHYVLGPVDGGRRGGMARLATLVREVKRENPNTIFAIGGDFL